MDVRFCLDLPPSSPLPYVRTLWVAPFSIQYKKFLKSKIGCFWPFSYIHTINKVHPLKNKYLKNVIHQIDKKWTVTSFSKFYGKTWVGFCLNSRRFNFKANRKGIGSSKKKILGIFIIALSLRGRHTFMWQSLKVWTFSIF